MSSKTGKIKLFFIGWHFWFFDIVYQSGIAAFNNIHNAHFIFTKQKETIVG